MKKLTKFLIVLVTATVMAGLSAVQRQPTGSQTEGQALHILVGKSVSSLAEAVAAEQAGADYLIVEPVFFSHYAQARSPIGPTVIRRIKAKIHLPLLAGGGITAGNAHQVIAAGADGVSVTSEIVDAGDARIAARSLHDAMREAWPTRPLLRESMVG